MTEPFDYTFLMKDVAASVISQRERNDDDLKERELMLYRKRKWHRYKKKVNVYELTLYTAMHARLEVKYC
jgi:hypothetical protein